MVPTLGASALLSVRIGDVDLGVDAIKIVAPPSYVLYF